jgi:hypothetical protein
MATAFHNTVDLRGIHFEDRKVTMTLKTGIVKTDEGKPVTIDTSANNTVKLAGDGDSIFGVLEVVENRSVDGILVGTISLNFIQEWDILAADTLAVGDVAIGGAAAGASVKKGTLTTSTVDGNIKPWGRNVVVSVAGGKAVVMKV